MQWNRILLATSILSFGVLSLLLIHLSQMPLCIESRVVERIDRLSLAPSARGPESIYRCSARKDVEYSGYFVEKLPSWTARIQKTEKFLESIEPFYRRVHIAVVPQQHYFYQIHNHQIRLGEKMMELDGHLERALIKVWYRERSRTEFASSTLMEEVMVDFLLFASQGELNIQDLKTVKLDWQAHLPKAPFILQSQAAYCESPWRRSEHFYACDTISFDMSKVSATMSDLSLRSLLSQSWIHSYKALSGRERYKFLQNFSDFLRTSRSALSKAGADSTQSSAMEQMVLHIRQAQQYLSLAGNLASENFYVSFQRNYTSRIHEFGFYDSGIEAQLDFILLQSESLKSDHLKKLADFSLKNPASQLAIRDEKSIWILPSRYPIAIDSFSQIKSSKMAIQTCGAYDFSYVLSFAEQTEKLLVVNNCDDKEIDYTWYLKEGIESFSAHHADVNFVQYHLPSLAMKAEELKPIRNVYDIIQSRWQQDSVIKVLGWQNVHWNETAKAFKPHAVIEGVEWFRTSSVPASTL